MNLLTKEFLAKYPDYPEHMTELAKFVYLRTYSRWVDSLGRRETWKETVARSVDYNVSISITELGKKELPVPIDRIKLEAEILFDNIFNLKQFLSGRTHWVGGAETSVADKFPLANFNCSFIDVKSWEDITDLFYLLLVGTGVGVRSTKENAHNMPPVRTDYTLIHSPYTPLPKEERLEHTKVVSMENGYTKIYVGDSKEGWVEALTAFLDIITKPENENIKHIKVSYNSIRPKGEKLFTFGGTASGYEPMMEMFDGIDKVFKGTLDPNIKPMKKYMVLGEDNVEYETEQGHVRPIHILDISNLIGNNVVVGGVRRTAEMFLFDVDDFEVLTAKYGLNGIYDDIKHKLIIKKLKAVIKEYNSDFDVKWLSKLPLNTNKARPFQHRRMSNNSTAFETKPSKAYLELLFLLMQTEGEPGWFNLESASKRRANVKGVNPCGEVLLDSYGVCNLTTLNMVSFVRFNDGIPILDYKGLMEAQSLSVRAGIRMTCLDLELPHWDRVHKRDRLIGASVTGWKDAMEMLGYNKDQECQLMDYMSRVAHEECMRYASILRIPVPLLATTVKPEGTLSQVAGGVSSGLHVSHAPFYIRRVRINAHDPLVKVAERLNWTINPEVGTEGETYEEKMNNARTYVIDFPVKSGAKRTRDDQTLQEQFDTYLEFQDFYTAHNSSNTISVRNNEWDEAMETVSENWDDIIGVTFLAYDGGTYELAPYETITEEEYNALKEKMLPFDMNILMELESQETEKDMDNMSSCDSGICPIF